MKKVFFILMFAGLTAMCAKAQLFVGGSLGFDYNGFSSSAGNLSATGPAVSYFELMPMIGFQVSDKLGIGVKAGFGSATMNDRAEKAEEVLKIKANVWSFSPFARLSMVSAGNLSLLLEGTVEIGGGSGKMSQGNLSVDGDKVFGFGLNVQPVLSYKMTDRLSIEATTNLAKLTFASLTQTTPAETGVEGSVDQKEKTTVFGFGANYTGSMSASYAEHIGQSATLFGDLSAPFQLGVVFTF